MVDMKFAPREVPKDGECERCGTTEAVAFTPCRTAYPGPEHSRFTTMLPEDIPNPNPDPFLCRECTTEYHSDWDAQWKDYYAGLM